MLAGPRQHANQFLRGRLVLGVVGAHVLAVSASLPAAPPGPLVIVWHATPVAERYRELLRIGVLFRILGFEGILISTPKSMVSTLLISLLTGF